MVVAEHAATAAMAESTTMMSTEVVDYTNFDEHCMAASCLPSIDT